MMLTDHLNLTGTSPLLGAGHFIDMGQAYCPEWRRVFADAAATMGMNLRQGVYAGLLGPQYETPAEVRMLRTLGADAVGMSTVLEAIQARALGLRVAAFSCLTNWGAGLSAQGLDHGDVMEKGRESSMAFIDLLKQALC
jgi:purine-nucleoside phosphorylase